jgi:anti-anti-sigma regulatory factor
MMAILANAIWLAFQTDWRLRQGQVIAVSLSAMVFQGTDLMQLNKQDRNFKIKVLARSSG